MKKKIFSLILTGIMSLSLALSSCQYILPKSVVSASLNERGELILTYSDNTTQNVGVVKGEDGKDGVDGKDGQDGKDGLNGENGKDGVDGKDGQDGKDGVDGQNSACEHQFSKWETQIEATCTSIGYKTRTCSNCGAMEYRFQNATGHYYDNPVEVLSIPCEQRLVNKTCVYCGDTKIEESYLKHLYDENGVCTKCGDITHFIESDEYIEILDSTYINPNINITISNFYIYRWWSVDRSYALILATGGGAFVPYWLTIAAFEGAPVDVILPKIPTFKDMPIVTISGGFGAMMGSTSYGFRNCITLKSVYIPDYIARIEADAFDGCTALESVRFPENLKQIGAGAFRNCSSLKTLDFKNTSSIDFWYSFTNCTSLKEIYFPLNTRTYNDSISFENCSLERIYISKEYRSYYINAFASYPNLQIISYE